jgi:hypothetical protein
VIASGVVDWHGLLQVVWASALAAVALVVATSLAILGAARANTERREGRTMAATLYAALAVAAGAVCAAEVALGVSVMLSKG